MEWIDYRTLPPAAGGFSELFFDYVYDYEKVRQFFPTNFRENDSFESVMKGIDGAHVDRRTLEEVLTEQNSTGAESSRTGENIRLLGKEGTYAVVTGQQVGLFGGPLYTLYKAITAIALAQKLTMKFPGKNFVPVFWIEGEDHDFQEMNHISVLDQENLPLRIEYLPGGIMPEKNVGAVGEMVFDETIRTTIDRLESSLARTEYTPPLVAALRECYAPGATFNRAFQAWLNRMLPGTGLVFLTPNHPRLKKLLSPLFTRELQEFPRFSQMVISRSAELERRYHAQVKPKSINLFLFHKGGRYLIEPRESDFSLKGTRAFFTKEQLLQIAAETPEQLSPNVVLRPLCRRSFRNRLPCTTAAAVRGPGDPATGHIPAGEPLARADEPPARDGKVRARAPGIPGRYREGHCKSRGTDIGDQAGCALRKRHEDAARRARRAEIRPERNRPDASRRARERLIQDRREYRRAQGEVGRGPEEAERNGSTSDRKSGIRAPPGREPPGERAEPCVLHEQVRGGAHGSRTGSTSRASSTRYSNRSPALSAPPPPACALTRQPAFRAQAGSSPRN